MTNDHDVIIVGARCAGSPTAMLLARRGHRVLVVDRATFPQRHRLDARTPSPCRCGTPAMGAARCRHRAPVVRRCAKYHFDFGPITISGTPRLPEGLPAYAPRRTVLDKILVDGAVEAGAEVREGFTADEVLIEGGVVVGIRGSQRRRREGRGTSCGGRSVPTAGTPSSLELFRLPDVPLDTAAADRRLQLLARSAGRRLRDLHPARPRHGGHRHQRRRDDAGRRMADR